MITGQHQTTKDQNLTSSSASCAELDFEYFSEIIQTHLDRFQRSIIEGGRANIVDHSFSNYCSWKFKKHFSADSYSSLQNTLFSIALTTTNDEIQLQNRGKNHETDLIILAIIANKLLKCVKEMTRDHLVSIFGTDDFRDLPMKESQDSFLN